MTTKPTQHALILPLVALSGLGVGLLTPVSLAQPGPDDGPEPSEMVTDRLEEADRVLPRVVRAERVLLPTRERSAEPITPGLTGGSPWDQAGQPNPRLPEGAFVLDRPGRLVPAPNGRTVFVPDRETRAPGEGPMLLLPSAAVERLELTVGQTDVGVELSGEVFVYHDRRHLMVTSFRVMPGPPLANPNQDQDQDPDQDSDQNDQQPSTTQAETQAETQPSSPDEPDAETPSDDPTTPATPASLLDDPEVRGLLEELEAEAPPPTRDTRTQAPPSTTDSAAVAVPDGTPIFRRRGRMVRASDGAWLFVFDNDIDDRVADQSFTVLPCRLLEQIERSAESQGDSAEMILSGKVFVHRGASYLLPTLMTRVRNTDIVPTR